jgi:hypothetical protein
MAAIASTSSFRSPRTKHADSFRPQFPINPFGSHFLAPRPSSSSTSSSLGEPWLLRTDQASFLTARRRNVVLVLGSKSGTRYSFPNPRTTRSSSHLLAPSESCVTALLASHSLVHSLIIFASHCPPALPSSHAPAVRILRLTSPLAVEDTGAVRLVSTLEWAERVARVWRASGFDTPDVIYYDEATKDAPTTTPSSFSRNFSSTASGSAESLSKSFRSKKGLSFFHTRRLSTSSTLSGFLSTGFLPPVDPSQRPFDAILNHISHDVAEKHVLKLTILITSITRPFLAPTLSPYHKLSEARKNSRRKSNSHMYSLPPTPPYEPGDLSTPASSSMTAISVLSTTAMPPPPSHMVHIVPPTARTGLIRSLDSFLSSFSQQDLGPEEADLAKQYILNSATVRQSIIHPNFDQDECTVLDLILLGGLDSVSGKAWIGSAQDLLFLPTSGPSSASSTPSMSRRPARSPSRSPPNSFHPVDPASPLRTRVQSSPQLFSSSGGGPPPQPRRSDPVIPSERDGFDLSSPSPRLEPLGHPQGPHRSSTISTLSRKATRRSKLNMITHLDDPVSSTSGLPTPPGSDEDSRQVSPKPRTSARKVSILIKSKLRWRFWKS